MILYHGSNTDIHEVDLSMCRPYKDFGKGFYCTDIQNQAELMAKRVANIYGGNPYVSMFELDESIFSDSNIRTAQFNEPTQDWAIFVLNNRNRRFIDYEDGASNHDNKYDIVIGPVANDDLALLFRTFQNGLIDTEALVKGMKYKKLTTQYSFHTDRALSYLRRCLQ